MAMSSGRSFQQAYQDDNKQFAAIQLLNIGLIGIN